MSHELDEREWVRHQTCTALTGNDQVGIAKLFAMGHGLPLHNDRWKNWDSFLAIHHAYQRTDENEPILDAGACRDPNSPSVFLQSLKKLGHTDLTGCNIDEDHAVVEDGIKYCHGNIEKTTFPDDHFAFIACLSTIEHGVDWRKYFADMARILKPNGCLFTSFDYWHNKVDTRGQQAFGVPIKIFNEQDVMNMALFAHDCGLKIVKRPTLRGRDRCVEWMGMTYTFMNLLMRKQP